MVEVEPNVETCKVMELLSEQGENLMMRKILLQFEKEVEKEP